MEKPLEIVASPAKVTTIAGSVTRAGPISVPLLTPRLTPRSATEVGIDAFIAALDVSGVDDVLPRTRQAYATDLGQFARFLHTCIAGPTVTSIQSEHVRAFCDYLLAEGRQPRTVARKLVAVRAWFRFLQRQGIRSDNPARDLQPPPVAQAQAPLTTAQIRALLQMPERDSFTGARNRAILELLYGAGLRLDELLALNLSHLDLDGERLRVQRQRANPAHTPLGAPATAALRQYLLQRAEALVQREMVAVDAGALFISARGRRLRPRTVQRIVECYVRRLDRAEGGWEQESQSRRRGPATLRAACEHHLVAAGADPGMVAALLGRQSIHAPETARADAAAILARYRQAHPRA
ncbi:MAG: tyrosine-type recombinase/integrase [bacterium]|nr:tyrosine-type recombinase/integrase [bacterium]